MADTGISPSFFETVSQIAHIAVMYGANLTWALIFRDRPFWVVLLGWGISFAYASVKEFWYDQNYEDAVTRGSNWLDWAMLMLGATVGQIAGMLLK